MEVRRRKIKPQAGQRLTGLIHDLPTSVFGPGLRTCVVKLGDEGLGTKFLGWTKLLLPVDKCFLPREWTFFCLILFYI